ncbi:hypothetical protein ACFWZ3_12865 [Frateuria sp. GZRR35]|uniref:hypothetical protein n=1 Tax=unclassified Frateuria TaxID=2648894 RepID=UPI003EDB726A
MKVRLGRIGMLVGTLIGDRDHLSRKLDARDIAAVAQWFAAQPLPAGTRGR